VQDTL